MAGLIFSALGLLCGLTLVFRTNTRAGIIIVISVAGGVLNLWNLWGAP